MLHALVHHAAPAAIRAPQALANSLAQAFNVSPEHGQLTITSTLPGGGDVGDMWTAMEVSGSLSKHMDTIASERGATTRGRGCACVRSHLQHACIMALCVWRDPCLALCCWHLPQVRCCRTCCPTC